MMSERYWYSLCRNWFSSYSRKCRGCFFGHSVYWLDISGI